jgi:hypothetical protein
MALKSRPNSGARKSGAPRRPEGTRSQQSRQGPIAGPPGPVGQRVVPPPGGEGGSSGAPARVVRPAAPQGPPPRRQEQRQRGRAPQRPPGRSKLAAAGAAILLAIVVVVALIVRNAQSSPGVKLNETRQPPTAGGIHVAEGTSIHYDYNPPSSGPHYPSPASWGVYPQALAPGTWVHNLEHGGIVVLYQCPSSCAALQAQLQALYTQMPFDGQFQEKKVIFTPFPTLDHLLRVQAWGWTMPLDTVDTAAIDAFYREHVNKGPEVIP